MQKVKKSMEDAAKQKSETPTFKQVKTSPLWQVKAMGAVQEPDKYQTLPERQQFTFKKG